MRTILGRGVSRNRILLLLAVIGPGIITSNVDNDPGGITTYSVAGSHYGYGLLWMMIPILIALIVIQEMCVRMAIVTGKGLADLIRENFGIKMTFYILVALLVTNMFNTMSEFAGVAAGAELLGISLVHHRCPMGAVAIALLIFEGQLPLRRAGVPGRLPLLRHATSSPRSSPSRTGARSPRRPSCPTSKPTPAFLLLVIGLVGTTIAPWMQFFIQASTVEKSVKKEELGYARVDVITGFDHGRRGGRLHHHHLRRHPVSGTASR